MLCIGTASHKGIWVIFTKPSLKSQSAVKIQIIFTLLAKNKSNNK